MKMKDKTTYQREEGGFSVLVNNKRVYGFRIKSWMNNLHNTDDTLKTGDHSGGQFMRTYLEYGGGDKAHIFTWVNLELY